MKLIVFLAKLIGQFHSLDCAEVHSYEDKAVIVAEHFGFELLVTIPKNGTCFYTYRGKQQMFNVTKENFSQHGLVELYTHIKGSIKH